MEQSKWKYEFIETLSDAQQPKCTQGLIYALRTTAPMLKVYKSNWHFAAKLINLSQMRGMYLQSSRSSLQSEIPQNQPSAEAQQPRQRYCPPCIRQRENRSSMTPVFPKKWMKNAGLWKRTEWSRISLTCITRAVCRSSGLRHIRSWHYGSDLRKSHTVNKRGGWLPRLKP